MTNQEEIEIILRNGENKNTEFKRKLSKADLKSERRQKLVTRIRFMTCETPFEGQFLIGIEDISGKAWKIYGLTEREFKESVRILNILCEEADVEIVEEESLETSKGLVGVYLLKRIADQEVKETCSINVAGRVNSGKSTLIGCLVTGSLDDGSGKARAFLLTHPQEITRGQTADIHMTFMGFKEDNTVIHLENPLNKSEVARVLDQSVRILTFFDAPGHKEYSKTMIRSILGADAQYGLVLIPGPEESSLIRAEEERSGYRRLDDITREHLILMSSRSAPFIVAISKFDRTKPKDIDLILELLRSVLKEIGKIPVTVSDESEIAPVIQEISHGVIVPIIFTSATNRESLELLTLFLSQLPVDQKSSDVSKAATAYIDKVYRGIRGTNVVVTGTARTGVFKEGQNILVGPNSDGASQEGRLFSIEMFKKRVSRVKAGDLFGFDIKEIDKHNVRRGQMVTDADFDLPSCREFEANIVVTRHPTRISVGYSPVLQSNTIQQTVVLKEIYGAEYLSVGDFARVKLEFLLYPEPMAIDDKIVLREANTRAIGTVVETIK